MYEVEKWNYGLKDMQDSLRTLILSVESRVVLLDKECLRQLQIYSGTGFGDDFCVFQQLLCMIWYYGTMDCLIMLVYRSCMYVTVEADG